MQKIILLLFTPLLLLLSTASSALTEEEEMAAMQRQLNQEVMEKPFSPADEAKVDAFIKDAMKKDLKPDKKAPSFWRPGYTCADIYRHGWNHYSRCRYYHRYYGRYWY